MATPRQPRKDLPSGRKHPHRLAPEAYRVPGQIMFATVCARRPHSLLQGTAPAEIVRAMGRVGRRQHVHICAYAIMPDHLHVVLCACEGGDMAKWLAYLKREVTRRLGVQRLWERSFWDHHAANDDKVTSMVECTLANPVHYRTDTGWLDSPYTWSEWHPETRGRNPNLPEWAG